MLMNLTLKKIIHLRKIMFFLKSSFPKCVILVFLFLNFKGYLRYEMLDTTKVVFKNFLYVPRRKTYHSGF